MADQTDLPADKGPALEDCDKVLVVTVSSPPEPVFTS